jgi:hypothetical protein
MKHWRNYNDNGKQKYPDKKLVCHYAQHNSHQYWPGIELGTPR